MKDLTGVTICVGDRVVSFRPIPGGVIGTVTAIYEGSATVSVKRYHEAAPEGLFESFGSQMAHQNSILVLK